MKILCVGMMVCDTLLSTVPYNILELDCVGIGKPVVTCGGDALNVAIGLAKLNNSVSIVGRIANDGNGKYIIDQCLQNNIDVSRVIYDAECPTASSFALIDETGERHFLTEKSIFTKLKGQDVPQEFIDAADYIYFGSAMAMSAMNEGGIYDLFKRARLAGKVTVMDASVNPDEEREWLDYLAPALSETDVFFPSLEEAAKMTGEKEPSQISPHFRRFGMKLFGIKLGAKGCYITDFKKEHEIPCPAGMPVVDTTGAGDSFMAGLICCLGRGFDALKATEFAASVATKNVGAMGGTAGIPSFEEAMDFYQSWKK